MEFRLIFDTIPEQFDRCRPRYCAELFRDLAEVAGLGPQASALEIGPGTGQATEPVLDTGCSYQAIELGANLCDMMKQKFGSRSNFSIINDDFITHDFQGQQFDLIYSAATIQWIPEEIAFSKTFSLLKPGGMLAMMLTLSDFRTPNEELYQRLQQVYSSYFKPETRYSHGSFGYTNAPAYGFEAVEKREYSGRREFTADEYADYCGTHCDHLTIPEPYCTPFFSGLRQAVREAGNRIVFLDTHVLYLARKPE